MKVLITGATGFVGSHFIEYLLETSEQTDVYGTKRTRSDMTNVKDFSDDVNWVEMDVTDPHSTYAALKEVKPDFISHLAAQSFVPSSWKAPQETFMTNAIGTVNVLEAIRSLGLNSRIQIAGTSEEYGYVKAEEIPIREDNPLRPQSPYGVSKVAADLFSQQYYRSYQMDIVVTRAFNHTGPRRGERFVVSSFCSQVAKVEKGDQQPLIKVGNLEAKRDFTDVRDMVRAYWLALNEADSGDVFNICSGRSVAISDLLKMVLNLSEKDITVKKDPERLRPSDVPILKGDSGKFRKKTGWGPEIPFKKTVEDTLNYWRTKL